ncbi:MAG: twin transmembrane helix small protein [Gammaproteobacteria bacterium]|jgi:preprotein translocase subunit SecG|nr:twin transmembrane helix small protein [Gammaproteobacteria bacterium]
MSLLTVLIVAALAMTVLVLLMDLDSMIKGGEFDEKHSNELMLARVALQGLTFLLLVAAFFLANS